MKMRVFPSGNIAVGLKNLLTGLLELNPSKRLGCNGIKEVMAHPYFKNVDWNTVRSRKLPTNSRVKKMSRSTKDNPL
jgi:hypothetical protein